MNEARIKMFLLYMINLQNHHIENTVAVAANPLNDHREAHNRKYIQTEITEKPAQITTKEVDKDLEEMVSDLKTKVVIDDIDEKLEDCYIVIPNGDLSCKFCPGIYKREGHMRNHLESKHNKKFKLICSCGRLFPDLPRLSRHRKSCKS